MPKVKLILAYDGTAYHGFQKQSGSGLPTIQDALERCLAELSGNVIKVIGAGRTDAGVHARGQVVGFATGGWAIPTGRIAAALNGVLPDDIVAVEACEVPEGFHARYSALAKTYSYTIFNHRVRSPFWRLYSLHVRDPLEIAAMRQAARHLVGQHDFSSFQATGRPVRSAVRLLSRAEVEFAPPLVRLTFRADGFLYNMVRIMVGTLVEVGLGRLDPEAVPDIIAARDRKRAGPTAPAHGLCLEAVEYDLT